MTIFFGSFQHTDAFHRILTIAAAASIVITAVYILRVVGQILYGHVKNENYLKLNDARWYERISTGVLIVAIAGIGMAPLWLSNMINHSLDPFVHHVIQLLVN
jgi:NADH-quinone oxidoreductase subunit M